MFALIWSKDKNVSTIVIDAFKRICFQFDESKSPKETLVKLLDTIESNLTMTFEEIFKTLFNDDQTNSMLFVDFLIDLYLKTTNDENFRLDDEIRRRENSFFQLVVFVVPFDRKNRLKTQISSIYANLQRQIETKSWNFFRFQFQIVSNVRTNETFSSEFFTLMTKKFVSMSIETNEISFWINAMKEFFRIVFAQTSIDEKKSLKFLENLAERIQWTDRSNRLDFIRLFASINAFLTHRIEQFSTSTSTSTEETKSVPSNLSQLEEELFQSNSLFFQVEKWIENVR